MHRYSCGAKRGDRMLQVTWNDIDDDVSEGLIEDTAWYRVIRNVTPFGTKWSVASLLPSPHPDTARFTSLQAAKDAVDASLVQFLGVLVLLGVATVPEP